MVHWPELLKSDIAPPGPTSSLEEIELDRNTTQRRGKHYGKTCEKTGCQRPAASTGPETGLAVCDNHARVERRRVARTRERRVVPGERPGKIAPEHCAASMFDESITCKRLKRPKAGKRHPQPEITGEGNRFVWLCDKHAALHVLHNEEHREANLRILADTYGETNEFGCWLAREELLDRNGYGQARVYADRRGRGGKWLVHRLAWALFSPVGSMPHGAQLDHLCQRGAGDQSRRRCFNPLHLEPVARDENAKRKPRRRTGELQPRINRAALKFDNLHEFAAEHGLPLIIP